MITKEALLAILDKNIDEKGLLSDIMKEFLVPYLRQFVSDTENKYDDALIEAIISFMNK
jgi:hypothetical protein